MLANATIKIGVTVFDLTIDWTIKVGFNATAYAETFKFSSRGLLPASRPTPAPYATSVGSTPPVTSSKPAVTSARTPAKSFAIAGVATNAAATARGARYFFIHLPFIVVEVGSLRHTEVY